jgi:WD40 repeat protein
MLASGTADGTVRLWDVADPARPRSLGQTLTGSAAALIAFSPDGHTFVSVSSNGDGNGVMQLWDITDPAHLRSIGPVMTGGSGAVVSVAFSPDGHALASSSDGTIRLWSLPQTVLTGSTAPIGRIKI